MTLRDGGVQDHVFVVEASAYISMWGVWPEQDAHKLHLDIREVSSLRSSPTRLPVAIANRIYEVGESGMGYSLFVLRLADGRQLPCNTGGAVDFVDLPEGVTPDMIVDVIPHEGRDWPGRRGMPAYHWCLFSDEAQEAGPEEAATQVAEPEESELQEPRP